MAARLFFPLLFSFFHLLTDKTFLLFSREILSPADWDEIPTKRAVLEPTVLSTIICPNQYVGKVIQLCHDHRGAQLEHTTLGSQRVMLRYNLPLPELAGDFYDKLKGCTSGYVFLSFSLLLFY